MAYKTRYLKLPCVFDLARLETDLAKITEEDWVAHFNTAAYENEWRCAPLRSMQGRSDHIMSLLDVPYANTALLDRCPYFREVIDTFECEKTSVRLMAMGPGSRIKMHTDRGTAFEDGMVRLHVPIVTTPEVCFSIEDEEVHFSAGHTWYLNASCLHGVRNDTPHSRIHLMLDCLVNPWLEKLFLNAGFEPDEKPKYGDPSINDDNVSEIIASLTAMGSGAGINLAMSLAAIRDAGGQL